jgi:hypothetical protein
MVSARSFPFDVAGDVPAPEGDAMHGENTRAHDQPAGFGGQREVAAADLEARQAGDDGDEQNRAGRNRLET